MLTVDNSYQDNYNKKTEGLWQNWQMIMRTVLKEVFPFYHHSIILITLGFIAIMTFSI